MNDKQPPIEALWARAGTAWATADFPEYGSPQWEALDDGDPRKLASMLSAAERWHQAVGGGAPWVSD
ncbi:DUF2742 domain-containing protein [Streptomyces sp. NPDC046853]|uniref:DUF2742 domain-containing protein n=1 Tax=Streptomyces sp. NPDC046853 TaxID=3154920 RepID=UPI0033F8D41F